MYDIFLLEGEEDYLKDKYKNEIKSSFQELEKGLSYFCFLKVDFDDLLMEISTDNFLGTKKLIFVEDDEYYKDGVKQKKILSYFKNLEEDKGKNFNVTLVFVSNKKIIKTSKFRKWIEKNGKIFSCDRLKKEQIKNEIIKYTKACNIYFPFSEIYYFIDIVGENFLNIYSELQKLVEYKLVKNEKNITKDDIDLLVIKTADANYFDITKNLQNGQKKKAVSLITNNFKKQEELLGLISYLYGYYFDIYLTILAKEEGKNILSVLKLPPNRAFLERIYVNEAQKIGKEKIIKVLKELVFIDEQAKQSTIDVSLFLKSLITVI